MSAIAKEREEVVERYVLLNDLAEAIGLDKASFRRLAKRSGVHIHKIHAMTSDNQAANALAKADVPSFFAFLETRGYGKAGRVVGADAVKGLVDAWRKA